MSAMRTGVLSSLLLAASLSLLSCRSNHPPDTPSRPSGPNSLWTDDTGEFWDSTYDRDYLDSISFQFDWGGGDTSTWTPFSGSTSAKMHHAWFNPGLYEVRARARDDKNAQSGWSEPLAVAVAYAGFTPNVNIDHGHSCGAPSIAIGPPSGEHQPIYVAMQDGPSIAFQKSTDAGTNWLADNQVVCQGANPNVTTDSDGNIYIVCVEGNHVYCVHSFDGGATWSSPAKVDDNDTTFGMGLTSVAADTAGHLFCAWNDQRSGSHHIWSSVSTDRGTTWSRNVRVDDDSTNWDCFHRDVFVQPGANHYLAAADVPASGACLYRSPDAGQTFEPGVRLETSSHQTVDPCVVADRSHVICAYIDCSQDNGQTKARTLSTPPDSWGPCMPVTDPSYNSYGRGRLTISSDGLVHTSLMMNYHDGRYDIYYAYSTDHGATWSESERVSDDTTGDKWNPDIGADSAGYAYIVWEDWRVSYSGVWFSTNNPSGVAQRPTLAHPTQPSATVAERLVAGTATSDAMGRRVMHPKPGVWFPQTAATAAPRKVVLTR